MENLQQRYERLTERTIDLMWRQWLSLGANLSGDPARRAMIDPEALLMATCTVGRYDTRLFDEAMDWLGGNYSRLSSSRMVQVMSAYPVEDQRVLAAVEQWVSKFVDVETVVKGVRSKVARPPENETRWLWLLERETTPSRPDEIFEAWGYLRGAPRIRRHSGSPDLKNEANAMLTARAMFGKGARADVLAYLCCSEKGPKNTLSISKKVKYDQKAVYRALVQLTETGVVENLQPGGRGAAGYYRIKGEALLRSLDIKKPIFVNWADLFFAIDQVLADRRDNAADYSSDVLGGERARRLTGSMVPMIRKSCDVLAETPLPDIRHKSPRRFVDELLGFLEQALSETEKLMRK